MKVPKHKDMENDRNLTRKHVAERNRRARINYYLEEIEKLITPTVTQNTTTAKLEKAEVLERTVAYLKQHRVSQMNTHQNYVRGFLECIRSIQSLLLTMKVSESDVRHIFHGCLSSVRNRLQRPGLEPSSTDINIMTLNNLARLRNLGSPKSKRTSVRTVTSSFEQSSSRELNEARLASQTSCISNVSASKSSPRKVLGVLNEMNNGQSSSTSKDCDLKPVNLSRNNDNDNSDSDNENNENINTNDNEKMIPDINYDDPMWRPW